MSRAPNPLGPEWKAWGERLVDYLNKVRTRLQFRDSNASASENGILLWDPAGYPVVSKNGEYRQIILADGFATFVSDTDQTTTANTDTAIAWDSRPYGSGIVFGASSSQILFEEAGLYLLAFSTQITSQSASLKTAYFWPRVNGTNIENSTIKVSLDSNGGTFVLSRSAIFDLAAGDYLQAYWATDDANIALTTAPATSFAPETPSVILTITRLRQ